ncbi:MAG TPA: amino acid adenylation domain-containing protein, partial [Thermoanaerobaculia bacterium]|nr:amino acid adenylation domain-containing protein [Thermoanaerobaculia bacterium]
MTERFSPHFLAEVLRQRAEEAPRALAYTFLSDGERQEQEVTWGQLDRQARAVAALLQDMVAAGDRALLLYPPGLEFIAAFLGCFYAGVVAVPAYPPRPGRAGALLGAVVRDARPSVVLTLRGLAAQAGLFGAEVPQLREACWRVTSPLTDDLADAWREPVLRPEDLAFLQYTSGSTSAPKGVMVSHANLLHNEEMIRRAFAQDESSVIVGWLPPYHDMGLIGNVLQPLYVGARCVLMSPMAFLQRPVRWLEAISRYRGTTSGGPNFAYELCLRKVPQPEQAGLDLGSWRVAFNGAEPVRAETLERFAGAFAPAGFRREALYPCYGLAEATLLVSGPGAGIAPAVASLDAAALEGGRRVLSQGGGRPARRLVSCGHPWAGQEIVIADPETCLPCAADQVGEIWIAGPSVAQGYWDRPDATRETFESRLADGSPGRYLRTGDLGVLADGALFVTGRLKDLIILRGRNLYPQDVELAAEASHPALRPGCGAAFPVEVEGEERLVVVLELERREQGRVDAAEVLAAVRGALAATYEVQPHDLVLVGVGAVPKTTSGKVRRRPCRESYLAGTLPVIVSETAAGSAAESPQGVASLTREELLALPEEKRRPVLAAHLREVLRRLTGIAPPPGEPGEPAASLASLGLDSLSAVELRNALDSGIGASLPLADLFQVPGLSALADQILASLEESGAAGAGSGDLAPAAPAGEWTLSQGQRGLWLTERLAPASGVLNIGGAARTTAPLDVEALGRALRRLVDRHPALRLVFAVREGEPWQRIADELEPELLTIDAAAWDGERLDAWLAQELYRPFDLERGPLLRAAVLARGRGEWVLLLAVHHLVADLWSLVVMIREWGRLYAEETGGEPARLAPLGPGYFDYIRWQEELLAGSAGDELWQLWKSRLAGELPVLELPGDRPRPPVQTHAGLSVPWRVSPAVAEGLRSVARRYDATLFGLLLAAFVAFLFRLTREEDLRVGSPAAGRSRTGLAPLVGYFVNLLVLRGRVRSETRFGELLGQIQTEVLAALAQQDFPFPLLAERLQPVRDPSRPPLVQVAFALQKAQAPELEGLPGFVLGDADSEIDLGGIGLRPLMPREIRVQHDLTLLMAERQGGLSASFQYAAGLFDAATVDRWAGHLTRLLQAVAVDPGCAVGELPLLSPAERHEVLVAFNDTSGDGEEPVPLHRQLERQAALQPDAAAVCQETESLTYRELNARANQLARLLLDMGIRPEAPVGVCLPRSTELVVSFLAVLKAGGAYMPLEPTTPDARLLGMLEDSGAAVLLTAQEGLSRFSSCPCPVLGLDTSRARAALHSAENPRQPASPESLAYVIYTSGSTGTPKGVLIPHAGLSNLVAWHLRSYELTAEDRTTLLASPAFDASLWEMAPSLAAGAGLYVVDEPVRSSPPALARWLASAGITLSFLPTPLAEAVMAEPWPQAIRLRALLTGGDRLSGAPGQRLPWVLVNHYGPTESSVVTTAGLVAPGGMGAPPIGRPIANLRAYVLDAGLRPVPVGVAGELHIAGAGLARGYLGRPEMTADRFVPDPWSGVPGGRLYRSGDLVRWRPCGELEFLGRLDHQVKVRGFRIEIGEIESVLAAHPRVREAAVALREDASGSGQLVAYVVGGEDGAPAAGELRAYLREHLPEPMVPAGFLELARLPLTANGKVDRRALAALPLAVEELDEAPGGPRTAVEELVAGLWSELLGADRVPLDASFFDLGGHSLLATRLLSRVRDLFGVDLPLREVFQSPTVAALAARIEEARRSDAGPGLPPVERASRDGDPPPSFAQERLWFLQQLEPDSAAYNVPAALRLEGSLAAPALAAALNEIVRRHEALRTTFPAVDGRPVQAIAPAPSIPLACIDLTGLAAGARWEEVRRVAEEEAGRPFDLAAGPLLRVRLLRLAPDQHALLLNLHHIVADGWSLGVLVRELGVLYAAALEGRPSPLPELPVQYADYGVWQRRWLAGEQEFQLAYWRQRLANAPEELSLPLDRPRPAVSRHRGAMLPWSLSRELTQVLRVLARNESVTLFMLLLTGLQSVLFRMTGQHDLTLGTPVANRSRSEVEGLIGLFVNTLVLRGDLSGDPIFLLALERVREATLGAYGHQDLPFEKLVEALAPERSRSRTPLFQVMLVWLDVSQGTRLGEVRLNRLPIHSGTAKLDLTFTFELRNDALAGEIEYDTELFDRTTVQRLAGSLERLLSAIAHSPKTRISELGLLDAGQRWQLLAEWSDTAASYPDSFGIHELVTAQTRRTPDAVALVYEGRSVGYGELDRRAGRLARRLCALGVGPEDRVGVCADRSVEMVVAMLGILKAGAAYVPLDPEYPAERLAFMAGEAVGEGVLLAQGSVGLRLPWGGTVVELDESDADPAEETFAGVAVPPESAAYVIYTSGSTGRPKGVVNSHRGIVNRLLWMQEVYRLRADDRVLQKTPFSFDVSVWEFFWPLLAGARLVIARPGGHRDPAYLARLIRDEKITTIHFVPSMLQAFLADEAAEGCRSVIRRVICSGEALPYATEQQALHRLRAEVWNLYGPTEAAVDVTFSRCAPAERPRPVPIGRPVANTAIYLVDRSLAPVPAGIAGELLIGGAQVARGYLKRPDLTAERFAPDPFAAEPGSRLYRTGDLARFRATGEIEYLGRLDQQVKLRGFRIELGEIEATLAEHASVDAAVAVARADQGEPRLVAYVVPAGAGLDVRELREHLGRRLPQHMVPAVFVELAALPLTPNGKVDRKALPAPEPGLASAEPGVLVSPQGPVEEALAAVWQELLGIPRIGRWQDFFALGGHSLLATRLVSRLRELFGVELPVREVFESPRLADLALQVSRRLGAGTAGEPLERVPRDGALPPSFAQERLWFLQQLEPASAAYNIAAAVRLEGALAVPALAWALGEVVSRHEVLRTTFPDAGGRPVQAIGPAQAVPLPVADLTGLAAEARREEVRRLAEEEAGRPFDLAAGPLLRVRLLRLAPDEHALLLNLHHVVADGWSMGVLVRELGALYEAAVEGRPSPLAELPVQYADYAVWQRRWLAEELERQMGYWRERLEGAPRVLELPSDRPRPAVRTARGGAVPARLPAELASRVAALSRRAGTTQFMTLLAGFAALLHRYTGEPDLCVGTPVAGRTRREVEGLIGCFVNSLVLRVSVAQEPSVLELLGGVREAALGSYAHQDLPFERLVEELNVERSLSHAPLFQVMFDVQPSPLRDARLPGLRLDRLDLGVATAKLDLLLSFAAGEGGEPLEGSLQYSRDLFDGATAGRLLGHFAALLAAACADPGRPLRDLSFLSEAESHQLSREWNDTGAGAGGALVHELFARQAAARPEAVALIWGGEQVRYGELARRVSRLARTLRRQGVGPDTIVGVCLERRPELVVALLAVLEAGGAYLPLDPAYPQERLALMLEDAGAVTVISRAELEDRLPASVPVCRVESEEEEEKDEETAAGAVRVDPDHLAYLIYTSGSTGRPKAVGIRHRSVSILLAWAAEVFGAEELSRVLAATSVSFDLSVYELFLPLSRGGTVVLAENALALPGLEAAVTLVNTVPSAMAELLRLGLPRTVRTVNLAGEALPRWLVEEIYRTGHVERVYNLYGPSEDTTYSTFARVAPVGRAVPIGRPIRATRVFVVEEHAPQPVGVAGELWIGGEGLARGYLGRPELTAERFVPDPFGAGPGARLYRTGDVARWLPDGSLEYLGRRDHQVKVRGFRIELGEIEAALAEHAGVEAAVAVARADGGEPRLVAYVVPAGAGLDVQDLRAHLGRRLPQHMVPALFVELAALPLTPNGKVDRKALPAPEPSVSRGAFEAPWTPVEELLAGAWREVLGLERVGIEESFFELGGHSLLATQVISRVRRLFGVDLPVRVLFQAPTVAGLARAVEQARRTGRAPVAPPLVPVPRTAALPVSFAQQRLWFLDRLEPDSPAYNIPAALRMQGPLRVDVLESSLGEAARRHESLRTSFREMRGEPVQVIAPLCAPALPVVDLSALPPSSRPSEASRRMTAEALRPFDLPRGPLWRAALLRLGPQEHTLLLTLHHIISDRWSMEVMVEEVGALYQAFLEGRPSPLPELTVQFADFAVWQRQWLAGEVLEAELGSWRTRLAGLPPRLELPADRPRPAVQTYRGSACPVALGPDLSAGLAELGRREGVTLFMTLLAGWLALLGRYAGCEDLAVGAPIAGRNRWETERLIGLFVNTLVLRGDLSGAPSWRELLGRVREVALEAYAHQDLPFERLVEELNVDRSLSYAPLVQVLFVLQNVPQTALTLPGLRLWPLEPETRTEKLDLTLSLVEEAGRISGTLGYATDLFDAPTAGRLLGHFSALLAAACADPGRPLRDLSFLSEAESHQLSREWNDT